MTATRIEDLVNVETEHLLGSNGVRPLVKLRAESDHTVIVGQMSPAQAREIALHLLESAARAEYEADLWHGSIAAGAQEEAIAGVLRIVRQGEAPRGP